MDMENNRRFGLIALGLIGVGAGVAVAYRNRFRIQRFLESRGIETPLFREGGFGDRLRSGVNKLVGRAEHEMNEQRRAI